MPRTSGSTRRCRRSPSGSRTLWVRGCGSHFATSTSLRATVSGRTASIRTRRCRRKSCCICGRFCGPADATRRADVEIHTASTDTAVPVRRRRSAISRRLYTTWTRRHGSLCRDFFVFFLLLSLLIYDVFHFLLFSPTVQRLRMFLLSGYFMMGSGQIVGYQV